MTAWKNEFKKYKKQVAQILLSPSDIKNKKSSNNAMATLENLLILIACQLLMKMIQPQLMKLSLVTMIFLLHKLQLNKS